MENRLEGLWEVSGFACTVAAAAGNGSVIHIAGV